MFHVILTLFTLPLPFQERRRVCSSVPFPKRQSAAVWGSSHSSSHWAATVSCCSSPHLQVCTDTDLSLLWSVSFHFFHICVCLCSASDFQSFYNILKNSRGHSSVRSAFSDRTEESSAVQYFQVREITHCKTYTQSFQQAVFMHILY